jgi:hypothetical protein
MIATAVMWYSLSKAVESEPNGLTIGGGWMIFTVFVDVVAWLTLWSIFAGGP